MDIQSFIQNLIVYCTDLVYPPTEEALTVRKLTTDSITKLIVPSTQNNVTSMLPFQSVHVRALIHEAKFHHNTHAQKLLAHVVDVFLKEKHTFDIIIPVPLSKKRLRERGYNQAQEILRFLTQTEIPILTNVVIRTRNTVPQTSLKREDRLTNLNNAFLVRNGECIQGKHILIIDDVSTTGATLHEIRRVFLPFAPRSVSLFALAH